MLHIGSSLSPPFSGLDLTAGRGADAGNSIAEMGSAEMRTGNEKTLRETAVFLRGERELGDGRKRKYRADPAPYAWLRNDAVPQGEIGILASTDPVAVDQAAVDMTFGEAGSAERKTWERTHNVRLLSYAEDIGLGSRSYRLVDIDG